MTRAILCPSLSANPLVPRYDSFGRLTNVTFPTGQVSSFRSDTDSSVHVQVETSSKDDVTITTNLSASGAFYTLLQGKSSGGLGPLRPRGEDPFGGRWPELQQWSKTQTPSWLVSILLPHLPNTPGRDLEILSQKLGGPLSRIHWLLIQVTSSSALVMAPRFKPFPLTLVQGRQRTQVITPNCGAERSSQKPGRGLCLPQNSEGKRPCLPYICQITPDTACHVSSRSMTVRESCCESPT